MEKAQTSIEYLLVLGAALVVVGALTALLLSSISAPQPQVHCTYSAFLNQVPLGPNDVNIDSPSSCAPFSVQSGQSNNVSNAMYGGAVIWVGAAQCDSTNSYFINAVQNVSLFLTDSGNNIVCADGASGQYLNNGYSDSLTPQSPTGLQPSQYTCSNPQKLYFSLFNCTVSASGNYDLRLISSNKAELANHTAIQVGAIIAK